jgi:hypothetical protein
VNALSGTGVEADVLCAALPPDDDPVAVLDAAGRDVPLTDVVALEDTPVLVLALDITFELAFPFEAAESDEVWLTFNDTFVVPEVNADVDDAADEIPPLDVALNRAFPELADAPDPAPADDPAVFEATAVGAVLTDDD